MRTLFNVRHVRRLALPHVPVEMAGDGPLGERAAGDVLSQDDLDRLQLADPALADEFDGQPAVVVGSLPGADLDNPARLLDHPGEQLAFVDGQGQRLLHVNVLARPAGVDHHLRVPVVGRADRHHVDILAIEQLAVVFEDQRRAAEGRAGLLADMAIDVGDGHNIAVRAGLLGNHRALVPHPDRSDAEPVVGASGRCAGLGVGRENVGHQSAGAEDRGGCLEETAAGVEHQKGSGFS